MHSILLSPEQTRYTAASQLMQDLIQFWYCSVRNAAQTTVRYARLSAGHDGGAHFDGVGVIERHAVETLGADSGYSEFFGCRRAAPCSCHHSFQRAV